MNLDEPINAKSRLLQFKDERTTSELTARDILSHRSGVPAHDLLWVLTPYERKDLIPRLANLDVKPHGFRNSFIYNNLLFMSLASLIESRLGQKWDSLLDVDVLGPLNMLETSTSHNRFVCASDRAIPYFRERILATRNVEDIGPAGALTSNLTDMIKWVGFNLSGNTSILDSSAHSAMVECLNEVSSPENFGPQGLGWFGRRVSYGLGWFIGSLWDREKVIFHSGNIDGFSSLVALVPSRQTGIVVLTNQSVSPLPGRLARVVLSNVLGQEIAETFPFQEYEMPPSSETPALPKSTSASWYSGIYENQSYGTIAVFIEGSAVVLRFFDNRWAALFDANERQFAIRIPLSFGLEVPLSGEFHGSDSGAAESISLPLSLDPQVPPIRFERCH